VEDTKRVCGRHMWKTQREIVEDFVEDTKRVCGRYIHRKESLWKTLWKTFVEDTKRVCGRLYIYIPMEDTKGVADTIRESLEDSVEDKEKETLKDR